MVASMWYFSHSECFFTLLACEGMSSGGVQYANALTCLAVLVLFSFANFFYKRVN